MTHDLCKPAEGFAGFEGFAASGDDHNREADTYRATGSWPAPRPISGSLAEVPELDPDLLPVSIRPWVVDIAERFQMPADYPAASVITTLAGALGRRALIRPKRHDDWAVYGNLWGAIVGRSGVMKSPVLNAALAPLRRRQALAMAIYESELDEHERQFAGAGGRRRSRRCGRGGKAAGSSDWTFDAETPQPPVCTRYITNETSIEKLHLVLKENSQGLLLFRDELSGWITQLGRPGRERERSFYLESWAGNGSYTLDRIGRGTVHAENLCLSVLGGIQPAPLQRYVAALVAGDASDDGLLQRFSVIVWPDIQPEWRDVDRPIDVRAERQVDGVVDRLLKLSPDDPFRGRFSPAAQELFTGWRCELEQKIRRGNLPPALESHFAKYRGLLPKLALIFHLADDAMMAPEIPLLQAQRAAAWCSYLGAHADRTYSSVSTVQQRAAALLAKRLRNGALGRRFTLREVYVRGWAGLDTAERARIAVSVLVEAGWVRRVPVGPGRAGRPTEEFVLNPAVRQ